METRTTTITYETLEKFAADTESTLELAQAERLVDGLTRQYRFFHWHVEFPHIFRTGPGITAPTARPAGRAASPALSVIRRGSA